MIDPIKNFAKVTLAAGIDADDTSVSLTAGHGAKLPNPSTDGAFNLVLWNFTNYPDPSDDPDVEIVRVTGRSGDTLTIARAQEGTSAAAHNTTGKLYKAILAFTKKTFEDMLERQLPLNAIPEGTVDGSNTNFTVPESVWHMLIKNGAFQTQTTEDETNDYTLSDTALAYTSPPSEDSQHLFVYIPA